MKPQSRSAANYVSQLMNTFKTLSLLLIFLSGIAVSAGRTIPEPQPDHFNVSLPPQDRQCSVTVSSRDVDFGSLSRWQMQETSHGNALSPGERTLALSVSCPYSQPMHIKVHGDSAADGNLRYGHTGSLQLEIYDAQVDGQPVQMVPISPDLIQKEGEQTRIFLRPDNGAAASRKGSLITGKNFTVRLKVRPQLPESETRVTAPQQSETRLTLEILP